MVNETGETTRNVYGSVTETCSIRKVDLTRKRIRNLSIEGSGKFHSEENNSVDFGTGDRSMSRKKEEITSSGHLGTLVYDTK